MNIKNAACAAYVTLENAERFYLDFRSPGRTFVSRMGPFGAIQPVIIEAEPRGKAGITAIVEAYLADYPNCPACGVIVDEPGYCDAVCEEGS